MSATRLFTASAWNHKAFLSTLDTALTVTGAEAVDFFKKITDGYLDFSANESGFSIGAYYSSGATPTANTSDSDLWYHETTNRWKSCFFRPAFQARVKGTTKLNDALVLNGANRGFELHAQGYKGAEGSSVGNAFSFRFTLGGNQYQVQWTTDAGLVLRVDGTVTAWTGGTNTSTNQSDNTFTVNRLQCFVDASNQVNIKYLGENSTGTTVFGYYTSGAKTVTTVTIDSFMLYYGGDHLSAYTYPSGDQATLTSNLTSSSNFLTFLRELPLMFDRTNSGGTSWVGSSGTAHQAITDGDPLTYAVNEDDTNPIGFLSSASLGTIANKCHAFIAGVLTQISSLGAVRGVKTSVYNATIGVNKSIDFKAVGAGTPVTKSVALASSIGGETIAAIYNEADIATMGLTSASTVTTTIANQV